MRVIDAEQALSVLNFPDLVEHLDSAHRVAPAARDDLLMRRDPAPGACGADAAPDVFLLRAAWQPGTALGVKLVTVLPRSEPTVHALYVLFDAVNGQPQAAIDGGVLTWYKTAADSALGAKYLAREDAAVLGMVGAGAMAPHLIRAHRALRPSLERVLIWNRSMPRAVALAAQLRAEGIDARAEGALPELVAAADVLCCATMTQTPLIEGAWLREGTHLDLVGAFTPQMREVDDESIRRSRVFVDCYGTALEDVGEIAIPLASGVLTREQILADCYELCSARKRGRETAAEITLFKNAGGGHLDLMTAQFIVARVGEADVV